MKTFVIDTKEARERAIVAVRSIVGADKVEVVIQPVTKSKTKYQRGYFHALCSLISKETGHTPAEIKQVVKEQVYGLQEKEVLGKKTMILKSSEASNREEYGELIDMAIKVCQELGINY